MKFVGDTPQAAERQAADFIREHCARRGHRIRIEPSLVEPGRFDPERRGASPRSGIDAAPRKIRFLPVRFGVGHATESGLTGSLSESGLSVITDAPVESGSPVSLSLRFESEQIDLIGSVVWMRKQHESGRAPGMGVRLEAPPPTYVDYVRSL